ncbi:HD domain-containing protein [Blastopirellula sp. JC732]|uniref:HD domain-containing protein n=1 Tax=Blastopirellula sediminis TaxID=2894196 RepID=A0A9X1MTE0_9BACT|nr:HD domain-containing protein [Blastopirellula sediminis]MCC9604442.1 HD domain-containing protein [Blastopirellula sediminis]MCC9632259.1 HD domain-containing protein [Blastopirellula sediminis]
MNVIEFIERKFAELGDRTYGEEVTERQHALQSAYFAEQAGAADEMVVACFLHDFGHFITGKEELIADQGIDAQHEELGARFLSRHFRPGIVEPGRLHVAAKRYLCATDSEYLRGLSAASLQSLKLQGGPMSAEEIAQFEQEPFWQAALELRRFDDLGKDPDLETPPVAYYLEKLPPFLLETAASG